MTTMDLAAVERMTGKPSRLRATHLMLVQLGAHRRLSILDEVERTAGGIKCEAVSLITEKEAC